MSARAARPGEETRVALAHTVGLRFKRLSDFLEERSANLSVGGMFVRTPRPHPVGSVFEFEIDPADGYPVIAGKAQVAWTRRRPEGDERPAGMGVRFVELDDDSRRAIQRVVRAHGSRDGRPQVVEGRDGLAPTPAPAPGTAAADAPPAAAVESGIRRSAGTVTPPTAVPAVAATPSGRSEARPARTSPWLWAVPAAAAAAAIWLLLADGRGGPTSAGATQPPAGVAASTPAPPDPAARQPRAAAEAAAAPEVEGPAAAVRAWASAWSRQQVDEYLASYSHRFLPGGDLGRTAWERQRRGRILAPEWIEIGLAFVEVERIAEERALVRFVQAYESDIYTDVVRKLLEMRREDGSWKIVSERIEP